MQSRALRRKSLTECRHHQPRISTPLCHSSSHSMIVSSLTNMECKFAYSMCMADAVPTLSDVLPGLEYASWLDGANAELSILICVFLWWQVGPTFLRASAFNHPFNSWPANRGSRMAGVDHHTQSQSQQSLLDTHSSSQLLTLALGNICRTIQSVDTTSHAQGVGRLTVKAGQSVHVPIIESLVE